MRPQDDLTRRWSKLSAGDLTNCRWWTRRGHLLGVLDRAQVLRWLQFRDELKLKQQAASAPMPQTQRVKRAGAGCSAAQALVSAWWNHLIASQKLSLSHITV